GTLGDAPLKDPRTSKYGPMPRDYGRYKGLYMDGDKIVLNYTAGKTEVWETPGEEMVDERPVFTRTIRVSASDKPLVLLADQESRDPSRRVKFSTGSNVAIKEIDGRNYFVFAPRKKATTYKVAIAAVNVPN